MTWTWRGRSAAPPKAAAATQNRNTAAIRLIAASLAQMREMNGYGRATIAGYGTPDDGDVAEKHAFDSSRPHPGVFRFGAGALHHLCAWKGRRRWWPPSEHALRRLRVRRDSRCAEARWISRAQYAAS